MGIGARMEPLMKSRYWEKLWHDILTDKKLWAMSADLKWRFITLIIIAGKEERGGLLPSLDDMVYYLAYERVTPEQLTLELSTLAKRELVELVIEQGTERWFVSNYEKRQAAVSDRERQSRRRSASASASKEFARKEKKEEAEEEEADKCHMVVTNRDDHVTNQLLTDAGIARNRTTAPLWSLDPTYVQAHLAAAKTTGLAIRKMLDGDPPPAGRKIPKEYEKVIRR